MLDTNDLAMAVDGEPMTSTARLQLDQFQIQKQKFDHEYSRIVNETKEKPLYERTKILYEGAQRLFGDEGNERSLANFDTLLTVARWNTSTMNNLLETYYSELRKMFDDSKRRSEYNILFALVMTQWLSKHENEQMVPIAEECRLAKQKLEAIIFTRTKSNIDNWRDFIQDKLFSVFDRCEKSKAAFQRFKKQTEEYGRMLLTRKVLETDIDQAIQYLLAGDSCDERQKATLKETLTDQVALKSLASSVNALMPDLAQWNWPIEGVHGVFRRNLAGKYRCYYQEDDLTDIFLQYIGLQWSYHFKRELRSLFDVLSEDTEAKCSSNSIEKERLTRQRRIYWMGALPDDNDKSNKYGYDDNCSDAGFKETLLDLIHVEIDLHRTVHPEVPFTVVCADLEDFGLSILHEVVQTFLEQCDVPKIWLDFFNRFLKQPVYHQVDEPVRQRERGVPIAHSLSHLFSELVLFGMDLYVYQNTKIFTYRLHDDFWFFDSQLSKLEQAWTLMNQYAHITGLTFNKEKCGSTQVLPSNTANPPNQSAVASLLPENDVKWGLLTLQTNGQFIPDQRRLTPFLNEMKERLSSARVIVKWTTVYNSYMAFFMRHFGRCANVLRARHIEGIVEAMQYIHRYLFPENNSSALDTLTHLISEQFPECVSDEIIEAWFYWPLNKGGLGIKNIYVDLLSDFEQSPNESTTTFAALLAKDQEWSDDSADEEDEDGEETSVTSDASTESCETDFQNWRDIYIELLEIKDPIYPVLTKVLKEDLLLCDGQTTPLPAEQKADENEADENEADENESQSSMLPRRQRYKELAEAYTQWLLCQYGEQIKSTFGRLDLIDSDRVPMGLVSMIERAKIDWNQRTI